MKKIVLLIVFIATVLSQTAGAQTEKSTVPSLLPAYYQVKDALVAGNAVLAAAKAGDLVKAITNSDDKIISKAGKETLLVQAGKIAGSKDLKVQREQFSGLSDQVIALAKTTKLSEDPAYLQYCPMKKSSWLSSEKAIKNPYYGSAMLSCGKVTETIK